MINLSTDSVKVMLTNTAPVNTQSTYANISATELAAGNGYATGGQVAPNPLLSNNAGVETFAVGSTTFTSVTGSMGPFRYVVYYDATAANQPLIGYYDYGTSITLNGAAGETFAVQPGSALLTLQ